MPNTEEIEAAIAEYAKAQRREYCREYREKNHDRVLEQQRAYYARNRERCNARQREYYRKNKERLLEYQRERRARKKAEKSHRGAARTNNTVEL